VVIIIGSFVAARVGLNAVKIETDYCVKCLVEERAANKVLVFLQAREFDQRPGVRRMVPQR